MPARRLVTVRVLGVDPGFASTGIAVLEHGDDGVVARLARLVRSEKAQKKDMVNTRVNADDTRRLRIIMSSLRDATQTWKPTAIAVEAFAPFGGRGGGNAWKTAMTFGAVQAFAFEREIPLFVFLPSDLKRAFGMRLSASKQEIAHALTERILSLACMLSDYPKGQQEHLTDATGHALLGIEHMLKLRRDMGLVEAP